MPTELGQRLQALRVQRGLTQVQLAQRAGVSQTVIARLEAGKRSGRLETWVRLAAALGVTLDELVGGEAQTPSEQENNSPRA
ncbi:MAG TPA: helix-turn-helix transcriptional regulator [Limnochorda sp.]